MPQRSPQFKISHPDQGLRQNDFFENSSDLLCILSHEGVFCQLNPAFKKELGFTGQDLVDTSVMNFFDPDKIEKMAEKFAAIKIGGSAQIETRYLCQNGLYKNLSWNFTKTKDFIYASARDITDAQLAENILRSSELRYIKIIDEAPMGIALMRPDGRFTKVNPYFCKMLGFSEFELLKKNPFDITHPDDHPLMLEKEIEIKSGPDHRFQIEKRYITKSGAVIWVQASVVNIMSSSQSILFRLALVKNITAQKSAERELQATHEKLKSLNCDLEDRILERTFQMSEEAIERKKALAALKKSESQLRLVTDALPALIAYFDQDLKYLFANSTYTKWFGDKAQDPIGKSMPEIIGPAAFEKIKVYVDDALAGKQINYEHRMLDLEGGIRELSVSYIPDLDSQKNVRGFVALAHDTTDINKQQAERNQLSAREQAAVEASRLKSEFLANMTHEIRTPLNGILGMADLLVETNLTETQANFNQIISTSGKELLNLVNDILDFSKAEAGQLQIESSEFKIASLFENSIELLKKRAKEKSLTLSQNIDFRIQDELKGDFGRLSQVISNLLSNAIKFTEAGTIHLHASLQTEEADHLFVLFEVEDSGMGISKKNISKLFQPFTQADGSSTRKHGGTGLGLSISKKIAALLGGEIGVLSQEGRGSKFWFTCRLERSFSQIVVSKTEKTENKFGRILVAEDNPVNQLLAITLLKNLGYSAVAVANGCEALEAVSQSEFDLILMDCQMPEMDGLEATRQIRKIEVTSGDRIPIIALTANAMKSDQEKCLLAGMDDFVTKPVKKEILAQAISRWLTASPLKAAR
jgi:PAS domain S-box-containing protein